MGGRELPFVEILCSSDSSHKRKELRETSGVQRLIHGVATAAVLTDGNSFLPRPLLHRQPDLPTTLLQQSWAKGQVLGVSPALTDSRARVKHCLEPRPRESLCSCWVSTETEWTDMAASLRAHTSTTPAEAVSILVCRPQGRPLGTRGQEADFCAPSAISSGSVK